MTVIICSILRQHVPTMQGWVIVNVNLPKLQAKEARKQREAEVAKAQMAAALNRGISWGMGTDAAEEEDSEGATPSVDWRQYAETHSLNDKQQKLADKLRRLENRVRNLTTEADRIKVLTL